MGKAVLALCLSIGLCLFGLPAALLYADEPQEEAASSSAAPAAPAAPAPAPEPATPDPAPAPAPEPAQPEPATPDQGADSGNASPQPSSDPATPETPAGDGSSKDADKDASSSSKEEDSDKDKDDKEKEDKDKEDKEKEEQDIEKAKEEAIKSALEAFDKAKADAESAQAKLGELPGLQGELAPCFDQLTGAWNRLKEVEAQREPFNQERDGYLKEQEALREERETIANNRETASMRKAKAVYGLMLVDQELAKTGGVDLLSVILGTSNATEAESYGYLLEKVASCIAARVASAEADANGESGRVDEVNERIAALSTKVEEVDQKLTATDDEHKIAIAEVTDVIERGNAVAYAMERICSESRQGTQDATQKVAALTGEDTTPNTTSARAAQAAEEAKASEEAKAAEEAKASSGSSAAPEATAAAKEEARTKEINAAVSSAIADAVKESKDWDVKDHQLRVAAQNDIGAWYDAVDALAGAEGYISYGMGLDFALDEKDFVEKWAAAINEFYVAKGSPPLGGWGEEIARQAYAYHIDPRLCAAVSINESGGGAVCIRPHNAWGWGAADSDPYNLASEWSSWPVAIESWHRGMATNGMGLATSPAVSKLSDIYCGTPIWAQWAVNSMEQMYEIARAQQLAQDKEPMAVSAAAFGKAGKDAEEGQPADDAGDSQQVVAG